MFFETLVSPRLAETIARETGARTAELNPIEGLSEAELEQGENYLSVMRANLGALRQALGLSLAVELRDVYYSYPQGPPVLRALTSR